LVVHWTTNRVPLTYEMYLDALDAEGKGGAYIRHDDVPPPTVTV
jgi:hypothetical protein